MSAPLVTIITVAYNSQKFIQQTIESVLHQSYENFEYIIIDDCSSDNTWQIINQYNDARIKAIKNDTNLTEYKNRNKAIGLAKGDYIVFVDGDDVALKKGIELAVDEIEQHKNCGFAIVKTENPKFIGPIEITRKNGYHLEYFGGGFLNSSLANNIFRTSLIKELLFEESSPNADTYLRLRLLKKTNVLVLINPISLWRLTSNQASKRISCSMQLKQHIKFIKKDILEDKDFDFFDKEKIKPHFYSLLYKAIKLELYRLDLRGCINLKKYFKESFTKSLQYAFEKKDKSFWSEYNYENLNINFK